MTKQRPGFMVFRFPEDAERYCDSNSESDAKAIRGLFDTGKAAYATEAATFSIVERFANKPYVKIENEELWPFQGYISSRVADHMRWKLVPEDDYHAQDWINAAYYAWTEGDVTRQDVLLQRAVTAPDATEAQIAKALILRAAVVEALNRPEEALNLLSEIVERFGNTIDPDLRAYVAEAMCDKGGLSGRKGKYAEALGAYEKAIVRFGEDQSDRVRAELASGLLHKGIALCELGRFDEAVQTNEELLASYSDLDTPRARRDLALAYRNLAAALYRLNRLEEAIEAVENLIERFAISKDAENIRQSAWALNFKGDMLRKLGRSEDAVASYRELISRFAANQDPKIQRFLELASRWVRK